MDGTVLAEQIRERLKQEAAYLTKTGVVPTLATILVGDDASSRAYLSGKQAAADQVGVRLEKCRLPGFAKEEDLLALINRLNSMKEVNGVTLQLPLPQHLNVGKMTECISPEKDVDGLTSANLGRLVCGQADLVPCVPRGIMQLLHHYDVRIAGSTAVIINRSTLVGKPLLHLLLAEDATVIACHSESPELLSLTRQADILVSAVGRRPYFTVGREMVKEGAVVVDAGASRIAGRFVGDVDFESVSAKASHINPVPGGVGPVSIAMLIENTLIAAVRQNGLAAPSAPRS